MATINPMFNETDLLEAAALNLSEPVSPTGEAVIDAVANLKSGELSQSVNLKNSSIELPTPQKEKKDGFANSLSKIDKFLDSVGDFLSSSKNPITNIFKSKSSNTDNRQSTNSENVNVSQTSTGSNSNLNNKSDAQVFNSIFATTSNELVMPAVAKIKESLLNKEKETSNVSTVSTNSILSTTSRDLLLQKISNSEIKELLTKSNVLEKELEKSNTVSQTQNPQIQLGPTKSLEAAASLNQKPTANPGSTDDIDLSVGAGDIARFFGMESGNESSVQVKSNTLVDSKTVNKMLAPDKTVEKTVAKLSKDLPAAVNNLSTSVTSLNNTPQSSITTVNNAGPKIDQSTNINNQAGQVRSQMDSQPTDQAPNEAQPFNQNEFYLQAIYSALMSGKVRVKIEHL